MDVFSYLLGKKAIGLPGEALAITGNCENRFLGNGWNWFVEKFGDAVTTTDITASVRMFYNSDTLTKIPFDINLSQVYDFSEMFSGCRKLESLPVIRDSITYRKIITSMKKMFSNCQSVKYIPEDYFYTITEEKNWTAMAKNTTCDRSSIFSNCYSLRNLPNITPLKSASPASQTLYNGGFNGCMALDEIVNLLVLTRTFTENVFDTTFTNCARLKSLTFETSDDGSASEASWSNQSMMLTMYVGYYSSNTFAELSQMDSQKQVVDDATYQALKNDPDWWTTDVNYSRYNHDSAVATINSLPDTSAYLATAGGTNTITFKGASGTNTDGGAINTLTESEIAVATAKGWTVSIV